MTRRRKATLAVGALIVLAVGIAVWFFVVSPTLNPRLTLKGLAKAVSAHDSQRLAALASESLADDVKHNGARPLLKVLEAAAVSDAARASEIERSSDKAVYRQTTDVGDTELTFVRDGMRWRLEEVTLTQFEETTVTVEPSEKFIDTKYLAKGTTAKKRQGSGGVAAVVYGQKAVNGAAPEKSKVEEREVTKAGVSEYWRGTGEESTYSSRLSDLRAGDSYNAATHRIDSPKNTLSRSADMFAIGFHGEPVDSSMKFQIVFLKPDGSTFIDDSMNPESGWTYINIVDYITDSYTDIMAGFWTASIMIDDKPAGFVGFEIEGS